MIQKKKKTVLNIKIKHTNGLIKIAIWISAVLKLYKCYLENKVK